jgi:hypothetical protein
MSSLDSIVDVTFRGENAGRIVVFSGDRRHRGYLVRSPADELRIKSFLKMFCFAHSSILSLGILRSLVWSTDINHILGRPEDHLARTVCILVGVYSLVVGFPYWFALEIFQKGELNFCFRPG